MAQVQDELRSPTVRVGRVVRRLRRVNGLTLAQLSERSGLSVPFLSQIENDRATPSLQSLSLIAQALDCRDTDLLDAARENSVVEVSRADHQRLGSVRELGREGGAVRVAEYVGMNGVPDGWCSSRHDTVIYVVSGQLSVSSAVPAGAETSHELHPGDRLLCGAGTSYRCDAGSADSVFVVIALDDRCPTPTT
ncbi:MULTISPECIES: helix-turn-helix domain-containing protein [unclassified Mycobacterium]|uniref:helix-turn-helix domain-containing protein n=1 Tax=unclassified Mycobacterium TaxID=2642494 RepID=UPI0029C7FDBD|nr:MULTISPECIES: helix-turn-helix domain-containing protein [unclassified Mycobacterium]